MTEAVQPQDLYNPLKGGNAWPSRERCGHCQEYSAVGFWVPNIIWVQVMPEKHRDTVCCLRCFARMADERLVQWDDDIKFYPVSLASHLEGVRGVTLPEYASPPAQQEGTPA